MKSPYTFFFIVLAFCSAVAAQGESNITLDLRPGVSDSSGYSGATRTRPTAGGDLRSPSSSEAGMERKVFGLLNAERRAKGLSDLVWNDDVAAVARMHSQNMASEKFFSHRGSDGSMVDDRADRVGLGAWRTIGENIGYVRGYEDPAGLVIQKWLESTAHRQNLLGANWKESAVGVAINADGTYYLTQVFLLRK